MLDEVRPIVFAGGDTAEMVRDSWNALAISNSPPELFRFGGAAVRIERDDDGAPFARPLTENRMRHELAHAARWRTRTAKGEIRKAPVPRDAAAAALAVPAVPLAVLSRVVEAPVLGPAGEIADIPGYHPATRTYYAQAPGVVVPAVSARPSPREIRAARHLITKDLLGEFPFLGQADRAHAVALLLQPFVRDLIDGPTPLNLIHKPTPGTGATLLSNVLALPALGRPLPAMTEGGDEEEWRKRITAKLSTSPLFVLIDNVRRVLDSAALSSVLTTGKWEDRVLGASEMRTILVRCAWVATGNNPLLSDELARRTVSIRLDAQHERPELRTGYRHPDLPGWATKHRGALIGAALTLGRAWTVAERPDPSMPTLGSYESWSRAMGGILETAGIPGFLCNLDEFRTAGDAEAAQWGALVERWHEAYVTEAVEAARIVDVAGDLLGLGSGSDRSQSTKLGRMLAKARDRRYGDWRIQHAGGRGGSRTYRLVAADSTRPPSRPR